MAFLRPCLACGRLSPASRCEDHALKPFAKAKLSYTPMSKATRDAIIRRDGRCLRCGSTKNLEADHIVPVSKGGAHTVSNGRTLCRSCHLKITGQMFGGERRGGGAKS